MTIDDEKLMAYADGELSAEERAEIAQALASDATLRDRLEKHQHLRARISGAYGGVLDEPVPENLRAGAAAGASRATQVVDLAERRAMRPRWSMREWGAVAASLAGGLIIGLGAMRGQAPLIAVTPEGLSARGALARALDTQLASDESGGVRIGLSFRARDGSYCRTFELRRHEVGGIACTDADGWTVAMTAANEAEGDVRMAGVSEAILNAVDGMIEGEPLNAEQEEQARATGWR